MGSEVSAGMARNIGPGEIQISNPHYDRSPFTIWQELNARHGSKGLFTTIAIYLSAIELLIEFNEYFDSQVV